jgi:hypothetical protein
LAVDFQLPGQAIQKIVEPKSWEKKAGVERRARLTGAENDCG